MAETRWASSHHPQIAGSGADRSRIAPALPARFWLYSFALAGIGALALLLFLLNFLGTRATPELRFVPTMTFPGETWERAAPGAVGVDSKKLDRAVSWFENRAGSDGSDKLVIVRYGKMIWAGPRIDEVQGIWSATKSFSGTLLCALADEGICHPDTPVADILPEMRETFPGVTLGHLVTMRSGYEAAGDWPPEKPTYRNGSSPTPFIPGERAQFEPGSHFAYWDSAMNVYGLAVTKTAGESMESLFARRIADPIGMDPDEWRWKKFAEVDGIIVNGGSGNKAKHVEISARQLARFGHFMLNRGRWNDQQLISEAWIDEAISPQVPADTPLGGPMKDEYGETFHFDGRGTYGFNWWVNGEKPGGGRFWPGLPPRTFGAMGYHNNRLFVIPEWNLVVVRLGLDGKDRRIERDEFAGFLKRIGKAIDY